MAVENQQADKQTGGSDGVIMRFLFAYMLKKMGRKNSWVTVAICHSLYLISLCRAFRIGVIICLDQVTYFDEFPWVDSVVKLSNFRKRELENGLQNGFVDRLDGAVKCIDEILSENELAVFQILIL